MLKQVIQVAFIDMPHMVWEQSSDDVVGAGKGCFEIRLQRRTLVGKKSVKERVPRRTCLVHKRLVYCGW